MTFLKWVGGKSQLLSEFSELFLDMNNIKGYIEPFLGGGSVFFYMMENFNDSLNRKNIYLSDINPELINCYKTVRDHLQELIPLLEKHQHNHTEEYYYKIRDIYPPGNNLNNLNQIEKAACFIYLNKTCFNGLWRVNSEGKNNVPIGHKEKIDIFDRKELGICSKLLKDIKLNVMSFENILKIKNLDNFFSYLDPPYLELSGKTNFTGYTKDDFHLSKKSLLFPVFQELDKRGCKIMLSQSDNNLIRQQFKDYNISIVKAKRMINSNGKGRGEINEIVVTNYKPTIKQQNIMEAWA